MKRYFLIALVLLLFPVLKVSASTEVLNRNEVKSSQIELSFSTKQGYATAIELKLAITGNATLDSFTFSSKLKSGYTKRYTYDSVNKVLTIYIATGNRDNLINTSGVISLGQLNVKKQNADLGNDYNVISSTKSATIINYDYKNVAISNIIENGTEGFVFEKKAEPTPPDPDEPSNPGEKEDPTPETGNNGEPSNPDTTPPKEEEQDPPKEEKPTDPTPEKPETNPSKKEEKKETNWVLYAVGGTALVVVIVTGSILLKRRKTIKKM